MNVSSIPLRTVPAHSRTEALKPDVAQMERIYEGFARSGLSGQERATLSAVESDWSRARTLRQELKAEAALIASGDADPQTFTEAAAHGAELKQVEADLSSRLEAEHDKNRARLQAGQGYGPLTVFESGGQVFVNTRWQDKGVKYELQRPLGDNFFDLCAEPVPGTVPGKESLTFLRADVRDGSLEMQLMPADQELRLSRLAPLGAGDGELVQHDGYRAGLEKLTDFQIQFATQVLTDLGMGWPTLGACAHCRD